MLNTTTHSLTFVVLLLRRWKELSVVWYQVMLLKLFFKCFFQIIDWNIVQKCTISLSNSNQHLILALGMYNGKQRSFSNSKHGCLTNSNMFSFGFKKPTPNLTFVVLLLRVWKGTERRLRKKYFSNIFLSVTPS